MIITLNIQADSPVELQEAIAGLANVTAKDSPKGISQEVSTKQSTEENKNIATKTMYFHHPESDSVYVVKKGEEIHNDNGHAMEISKGEYTKLKAKYDASDAEERSEEETQVEEGNIPSIVDLRAKAQEKGKTPEGKKAIKALLEEFDSKSISAVPEAKRAAFMAALEEL